MAPARSFFAAFYYLADPSNVSCSARAARALARFLRQEHEFVFFEHNYRKTWILIVFSMHIVAPDERRTTLLRTLGSMLGPTRVAPGCLDARLYSDLDKRKTLLLVEDWESREQFERNLDMAKLSAIVAAIELSSEAPVVRVDVVEREEGVDALSLHRSVLGATRPD
jgi:quinol monooxygenase YgiN